MRGSRRRGTFSVVDAVAVVTHRTDVATVYGTHPYRTELEIRLTDFPSACGLEMNGLDRRSGKWVSLVLMEPSDGGFPGLPDAGTYALSTAAMPWDTPSLRGMGEMHDCMGDCGPCASLGVNTGQTGSITLTQVTPTQVQGTFSFVDSMSTNFSGSFTAPICAAAQGVSGRCCWSP
jgi:hypothetical protein